MQDYGKISIITPAYNCASKISETIESVQAQTYQNWEMLITDDCSSDETKKVVTVYAEKDPRIKYFCLEKNSGAGVARNNSIKEATGKYIAFLDSDDRWLPTKLEKQLALMQETGCPASYTSYFTCTDKGDINGIILCRKNEDDFSIKCDDKMGNLTFMYDETVTGKLYMPSIRKRQDWAHKMAIMNICKKACGVQEPLAIYRHSETSISKKKTSLAKFNIAALQTLGWSKLKATLFFFIFFLPSYFLKRVKVKMNNGKYKEYLERVEE